jgi:sterol desaturase/sphingolipid hydroxylase (fatty acid hydroxylase superfamily)
MPELNADTVYLFAMPFFVLTMLAEWQALKERRDLVGYTPKDTFASLSLGIGYLVLAALYKVVLVAAYLLAQKLSPWTFEMTPLLWVAAFLLQDFCFYWYHRAGHEVRLMWAAHVNHHSSNHYNLSTALRQSWTEHLFGPLFWIPMAIVGFPIEVLLAVEAASLLYQYVLHTELIRSLGPLEWVLNTPSHHRVHHGRNLQYMDKNYGGILIIWDRMFGTFEPEQERVEYGITTPLTSYNPVVVAFHEWAAMLRDVAAARTVRGKLGAMFGPPGWREDGNHLTVKALIAQRAASSSAPEPLAEP